MFNDVIAVDPTDPKTVYITGVYIWRSTTSGTSFTNVTGPNVDLHTFAFDPKTASIVYALGDNGIYQSKDKGSTWSFLSDGITNILFYDITSAVTQPNFVIGGAQDNGNSQYDGSSTVWKQLPDGAGDGATVAIDPTDPQFIYTMGQYLNQIQQSTDGGTTFKPIPQGLPADSACINAYFQVDPLATSRLLACCQSLWFIGDPEKPINSWSKLFTPSSGSNVVYSAVDVTNKHYYVAASDRSVYASVVDSPLALPANFQLVFRHPQEWGITDIKVDFHTPANVYVSFRGPGPGGSRVYRLTPSSVPKVVTMTAQDITADLPNGRIVSSVAADLTTPLTVYAGTDMGVYRGHSSDGGMTWSWIAYNNGLPLANVTALEVHPTTGALRAATYGRSAFEV